MGQVVYDSGKRLVRAGLMDRIAFAILAFVGIEAALYFADYWFFGGHRVNMALFVILSYVVFRGVFRTVASWLFYLFVSIPPKGQLPVGATVDVLTTAMPGEPFEMFEKTLRAIGAMTWPHTTYLLDGGNDPALQTLCGVLGVVHVDCRGVPGAKAGKINYCLKNLAVSEFVLVLDPDHIPQPDFLQHTLPCFADEKVGFVQVVQAYYNTHTSIVARASAEQTYGFYGPLQMGLDGLDSAIAIGANCTFRRAAFDSIGGHAEHLAEDACTSLRLHAAGWKSRYVPYRASYGLVPQDLQTFFSQQLKWAKGMFDLFLFGEYRRAFSGLLLRQKLYYAFAGTFYLSGIVTGVTIVLPVLFLFFKWFAIEMPIRGFFLHLTPYAVLAVAISYYIQRWYTDKTECGLPWRSMFLEKGTWHIYTLALVYALIRKKVTWIPTAKTGQGRTSILLLLPHIIGVVASVAAIVFAATTYHRIDDGTSLMMFFAALNACTLTPVIWWGLWPRQDSASDRGRT